MILVENKNDITRIYNDMLTQFPTNELKSFEQFEFLSKKDEYIIYNAIENNQNIGYIIIIDDKNSKNIWIDYIAIFKQFQSKGYGHKVLEKLKELYAEYNGCFLEVEKENNNNYNTIRRVNFYKSQGAIKLPIEYYYPDYKEALAMDLFYFPYQNTKNENTFNVIKTVFSILHTDVKNLSEIYNKIKLVE